MPVLPSWCFEKISSKLCVMCAVTDLVSLSSCWSYDTKFADELTLVQLKFSSIKTARLTLCFWIRFSVVDIFICRNSLPVHPPIWHTRICIVPSSLIIGISPNCSTSYVASFSSLLASPGWWLPCWGCPPSSYHTVLWQDPLSLRQSASPFFCQADHLSIKFLISK
jgi:hypothetical protein